MNGEEVGNLEVGEEWTVADALLALDEVVHGFSASLVYGETKICGDMTFRYFGPWACPGAKSDPALAEAFGRVSAAH
jgi:hypothetical protein